VLILLHLACSSTHRHERFKNRMICNSEVAVMHAVALSAAHASAAAARTRLSSCGGVLLPASARGAARPTSFLWPFCHPAALANRRATADLAATTFHWGVAPAGAFGQRLSLRSPKDRKREASAGLEKRREQDCNSQNTQTFEPQRLLAQWARRACQQRATQAPQREVSFTVPSSNGGCWIRRRR
jgi:hypothetical protein